MMVRNARLYGLQGLRGPSLKEGAIGMVMGIALLAVFGILFAKYA